MSSTDPTITINGQTRPLAQQSLNQLLKAHGFDPEQSGFAVAVNAVVARRTEWDAIQLQPGDKIEIIQAAAGG